MKPEIIIQEGEKHETGEKTIEADHHCKPYTCHDAFIFLTAGIC